MYCNYIYIWYLLQSPFPLSYNRWRIICIYPPTSESSDRLEGFASAWKEMACAHTSSPVVSVLPRPVNTGRGGGETKESSMKNISVKVLITNRIIWNSKQKTTKKKQAITNTNTVKTGERGGGKAKENATYLWIQVEERGELLTRWWPEGLGFKLIPKKSLLTKHIISSMFYCLTI